VQIWFVAMLKQIMRRRRKPLFLVLDSLPAHKAKGRAGLCRSDQWQTEMHFLPGYAPELNPDELVWSHMKRTGTAKRPLAANECCKSVSKQTSPISGITEPSFDPSSRLQMSPILLTAE